MDKISNMILMLSDMPYVARINAQMEEDDGIKYVRFNMRIDCSSGDKYEEVTYSPKLLFSTVDNQRATDIAKVVYMGAVEKMIDNRIGNCS